MQKIIKILNKCGLPYAQGEASRNGRTAQTITFRFYGVNYCFFKGQNAATLNGLIDMLEDHFKRNILR